MILPLLVKTSLAGSNPGELVDDSIGFSSSELSKVLALFGGFWSMSFSIVGSKRYIEEWAYNGLGRHVTLLSPDLSPIWEGSVEKITANIGSLSVVHGPLLDETANVVRCVVASIDDDVYPPVAGQTVFTDSAQSESSIARYGEILKTINAGTDTIENAELMRDEVLASSKFPPLKETDNLSASSVPKATIECTGYINWLKVYRYTSSAELQETGRQNSSEFVKSVLAADPNGIFSDVSTARIDDIATPVPNRVSGDNTAFRLIQDVVSRGDYSGNKLMFSIGRGRTPTLAAVPTSPDYKRNLVEPLQNVRGYDSGGPIRRCDMGAGKVIYYTDFLSGVMPRRSSNWQNSPLANLVTEVTFTVPRGLTIKTDKTPRLDQAIGRRFGIEASANV